MNESAVGGTSAPDRGMARRKGRPSRRAAGVASMAAVLVLGLGACSMSNKATDSMAAAPATTAQANAATGKLGAPAAGGQGVGGGPQASEVSFKVDALDQPPAQQVGSFISTASLTVKVDSVAAAKPKVVAATQALGGGLFGEQTTMGEQSRSVITLKVAPEKFTQLLDDLAKLGTLAAEEVKTDDVTQQVIDLDARIKASESSLERVRALLDKATSINDITQLEGEVSRRQADLESLRGQKVSLDAKVELSTVVVTLVGEKDATPAVAQQQQQDQPKPTQLPGFADGLSGGLKVGGNIGTVLLAAVGAALPFLPVVVLAFVGFRLLRRAQRRATATPAPTAATTGP